MKNLFICFLTLAVLCAAGQTVYASNFSDDIDQLLKPAKGTLKTYADRISSVGKEMDKTRSVLSKSLARVKKGSQPPTREYGYLLLGLCSKLSEQASDHNVLTGQFVQYQIITRKRFFELADKAGIMNDPSLVPIFSKKLDEFNSWTDKLKAPILEQRQQFDKNLSLVKEVTGYMERVLGK
jgi:hypothetical protein